MLHWMLGIAADEGLTHVDQPVKTQMRTPRPTSPPMHQASSCVMSACKLKEGGCVCVCVSEGGCVDELRVVVFGGPMKLATHDYASSEE